MSTRQRRIAVGLFDEAAFCASVGHLVKVKRKGRGWTQLTLATRIGCLPNTISRLEQGRGWPEAPCFLLLCAVLDIPRLPYPTPAPSLRAEADALLDRLPPHLLGPLIVFLQAYLPTQPVPVLDLSHSSLTCGETVSS